MDKEKKVQEEKEKKQEVKKEEKTENKEKELNEQISKLKDELADVKDRHTRLIAEFDNLKKRSAKEREGLYNSIIGDIISSLLPVIDNLEKATEAETKDEEYKKGIELVLKQFKDPRPAGLGAKYVRHRYGHGGTACADGGHGTAKLVRRFVPQCGACGGGAAYPPLQGTALQSLSS